MGQSGSTRAQSGLNSPLCVGNADLRAQRPRPGALEASVQRGPCGSRRQGDGGLLRVHPGDVHDDVAGRPRAHRA